MRNDGKTGRAWRWVASAAVAGALAGAAAVYVGAPSPGNGDAAPDAVAAAAADRSCAAKSGTAKSVAGLARGEVAAMLPADPPVSLAGLDFEDEKGKPLTVAALSGKALLVNLWATWCAPCRAEMPALDRLQAAAGGDRFEVVAVNLDKGAADKPNKFLDEIGVSALRRYRDPSLDLFEALKARGLALGLPATFLVDREGCLLALMNGPADWSGPDARRLVEAAIGS